jgi:integrase
VRAIFRAAAIDGIVQRDPCLGVKLPELPHRRVVPLALEQIEALVEAVPERYRALLAMDAGTGLRQGEAFGVLLTDDEGPVVDFLRRALRVQRQFQPRPGGVVTICPLKSRASYRTVPMGQVVLDVATRHIAQFPPPEVKMLDETDPSRPVLRMVRPLFTDDDGNPLHRTWFDRNVWHPARTAAGLPEVTMHDLRHWYASALIRAGLNVKIVAERLGHANASMTLNVYTHLFPDDEDRSRQAIDEAFAAPREQDRLRSVP